MRMVQLVVLSACCCCEQARGAPLVPPPAGAAPIATGVATTTATAMLFLDGSHLASWTGLQLSVGSPQLLSEYRDPSSFIGCKFSK